MECLSLLIPRFVHAWNSIWTSNDSPAILWIMFLHLEVFEWKAPHCEVFCLGVQRSTTLIAWSNHSLSRHLCQASVGSKKETQKHLNFCTENAWMHFCAKKSTFIRVEKPKDDCLTHINALDTFRSPSLDRALLFRLKLIRLAWKNCAVCQSTHDPYTNIHHIHTHIYTQCMYVHMYVC